jgi:hypothetical protein
MEDLFMRTAIVMAVAVAAFSSFPGTAQQKQETPQQQQTSPSQPTAPAQQSAPTTPSDSQPTQNGSPSQTSSGANSLPSAPQLQLQPVNGELVGKLDSTSAKAGDSVVVKTRESVKTADGTDIPKGSKLMGRVTGVQARGEGKENSQIAIKFDHAELKGGQNMPIESVIQSVSPAGSDSASTNGGSYGSPTAGGMSPNRSAAPGSSAAGGGTATGGSMGNGGTNSQTNGSPATNSFQGSMQSSREDSGQSGTVVPGGGNAPAPGSIVARNGNVAIRMTAIPGVLLANNVNGQPFSNASGMLLGARRDIKLDGGTQVVLAVAAVPGAGAGGGSVIR